jgi:SAM-dependent methyltransferase
MRLRDSEDAMGHAFQGFLDKEGDDIVIERDDGYVDVGRTEQVHYFSVPEDWPMDERRALRLVRGRVLDVGCGVGRHSLYLQDRGCEVVAIDVSPIAVKICRSRGVRDARVMALDGVSGRMGSFDAVIMMGNNFGLFGSPTKAKRLLKRLWGMTNPGARIIGNTMDTYQTTKPEHLWYHRFNRRRGRLGGQVRIRIRYKKYCSPWFDYLFASRDEMREILDGTGWRLDRTIPEDEANYFAIIRRVG